MVAVHRLGTDVEAEVEQPPGATRMDFAEFVALLRRPQHGTIVDRLIARDADGDLIGSATLTIRDDVTLRGVGKFHIEVPARLRRQGIGTALLEAIRARSRSYDVHTLYSWAPVSGAGLGFLANSLQRPRGEEIWSVLDLRRPGQASAGGPSVGDLRPPAVELRHWIGPCPAESLDDFAAIHRAVGASVRGSAAGSELVTPELIHTLESTMRPESWLTVAAYDLGSATIIGFSQIDLPRQPSRVAHQQYTGVDPQWHRRGVAGRLKTRSRELLRAEQPDVDYVITENAADNTAIRRLNVSMGFRVYRHLVSWAESIPVE
jgi:GNAT superfamily N-acetyltransferase